MIVEVEKSFDLLSTSWRPREAGDIAPVQTRRLENRGNPRGKSQSKGRRRSMS